ncbi:MAG: hypothetical protein ACRDH5_09760, partial [bacterium]
AKFGIYSVTPVVPAFERQADWLAHRTSVFEDLAPDGYIQEVIAERVAIKTWRLRRLVRYEREQIRHRQRAIPEDLALNAKLSGRKVRDDIEQDLELIDRWSMNALIPHEKELAILMRWEGRLTRELRLDELHLEHMKRQKREGRPTLRLAEPEPEPALSLSKGLAEPEPAEPESPGPPNSSPLPRTGEGLGVRATGTTCNLSP